MQKFHSVAQLIGDVTDLLHRIRFVVVVLEKIEHTESQHFKSNAGMTVVIEPIQNLHAQAKKIREGYSTVNRMGSSKLTVPLHVCPQASLKRLSPVWQLHGTFPRF